MQSFVNGEWTILLGNTFVRWYPAEWTLQERKQHEQFQAVVRQISEDISLDTLVTDGNPSPFLQAAGFKAFKIIKTVDGSRKLVGYYELWDSLQRCINTPQQWKDGFLNWSRHFGPPTTPSTSQKNRRSGSNHQRSRTVDSRSGANLTPLNPI